VAAALAWPWLEDKRELLASFAARAGVLTLETVGDVRAGDPVALVKAELLGPKAAPLVPALLAHLDSELGARALVAAGALAPVEAAARKGVQPALRALARLAPPSAVPVLREVLDGSTGEGRCAAAYGLGRLGAERARLLELLVEQGNTELGKACRDALATMRAVDELLDALSRDDWGLRWAGAVGLGRCGDASARVREALAKSLTHPGGPPISRTAAVTALLQLGEPRASVESLVDAMASYPEPSVREAVPACRETLGAR
jgi:HEAT repeat protein